MAQYTFEKCENNGFQHKVLNSYSILKGKEYRRGMH